MLNISNIATWGGEGRERGREREREVPLNQSQLEPVLVGLVTPDLKSGLSPNLRTYEEIKCVFRQGKERLTTPYPLRFSYIIAFMAKLIKHPAHKDLKPSTSLVAPSSAPGPR